MKNKYYYIVSEIIRDEQGQYKDEQNLYNFDTLQELANYLQKPIGTIKAANKRKSLIDCKYKIYRERNFIIKEV